MTPDRKTLEKFLAINRKLNSTLNLSELLNIIMRTAAEVMRSEVASLLLFNERRDELVFRVALGEKGGDLIEKFRVRLGEGIAGHVAESGEAVVVNDVLTDKRFAKRFDEGTGFRSKAILCVPVRSQDGIIGVLEAINPLDKRKFKAQDIQLLQDFSDQAAIAIEKAELHKRLMDQEKVKQELKIAHEIQQNFLPSLDNDSGPLDLFAHSSPARSVGGDFYDALTLSPTRYGILIADVSGKGVPAALMMVNAISNFRFLSVSQPGSAELMTRLNTLLVKESTRGMFITASYLILDIEKKTLQHSSAGHYPILRRTHNGHVSELANPGGIPLGLAADTVYDQSEVGICPGDTYILYTDGISEARNKNHEEYGLKRLMNIVTPAPDTARKCGKKILADVGNFTSGASQHDDMTLIIVRLPLSKSSL